MSKYIIRELNPSEFKRLDGHPALQGFPVPDPKSARIIIAESDTDEIVGFWVAITTVHLEPIWIREDYRGTSILSKLWKGIQALLDRLHINTALSCADRPEIEDYLHRLGFMKTPYSTFIFTDNEKLQCQFR